MVFYSLGQGPTPVLRISTRKYRDSQSGRPSKNRVTYIKFTPISKLMKKSSITCVNLMPADSSQFVEMAIAARLRASRQVVLFRQTRLGTRRRHQNQSSSGPSRLCDKPGRSVLHCQQTSKFPGTTSLHFGHVQSTACAVASP